MSKKLVTRGAPPPVNYETARRAIVACSRVDECKEWADRAAALVTYAKRVRDNAMKDAAQRIQLRARVRIGELLLEIPNAQGKGHKAVGPAPGSRRQTILLHKLGDTALTCIAMARVPARMREQLIEASPPVTATMLAGLGTRKRYAQEDRFRAGVPYRVAVGIHNDGIGGFLRWAHRHPPVALAQSMTREEAARLREYIRAADHWLAEFYRNLP